MLITAVIRP